MPRTKKAPPQSTAPAKRRATRSRRPSGAASTHVAYLVSLDDLVVGELPSDVSVALVPSSTTAERWLKRWDKARPAGRIVPTESHSPGRSSADPIESRAFEPDARARALLRGRAIAKADLEEAGGAFDLEEVRTLLHDVSRQRIMERAKEGSLLWVPGPSNRRRYPTVQFTRKGEVVDGLKEVRDALPTQDPWAVLNFFVQPDDRLDGRRPIDVLKDGDVERVVMTARQMAQQGG